MPAGVWSKSLNTVYHNETLRGGAMALPFPPLWCSAWLLHTSKSEHYGACADFWGPTHNLPGGDYKVALGVFTQLGRTPGDKGPMPTFAGATQQKQQEIFILGAKLSEDGKTYCWPFSVGHCVCLELTTSERESLLSLAGGKKKKMELKTSLWLTASVVVFLLQNICVLLLSDLKQQHPPQLWLCCMTLIPAQRGSELHSLFWITSFCLPADSLGWPRSLHCCGCLGHFRSALLLFSTSKARRLVSEGGPPRLSVRTAFSKCFAFPYSVSAKRQKVTSRDTKI